MPKIPVSAPPFFFTIELKSTEQHYGLQLSGYSRNGTDYESSMTDALAVQDALMGLMPPDVWCVGISVRNNDPSVLRDGYINYFDAGSNIGLYVPTLGGTAHSAPWEKGITIRLTDAGTLQYLNIDIRPVPINLIAPKNVLTPDLAYTTAMTALESVLLADVVFPKLASSGTFNNIVTPTRMDVDYSLNERDVGIGQHKVSSRRRTKTGPI